MKKVIQELKIKLIGQVENLSEASLQALDLYMEFLLKQQDKGSEAWDEDEFLKNLEQKRRNDRTKFL